MTNTTIPKAPRESLLKTKWIAMKSSVKATQKASTRFGDRRRLIRGLPIAPTAGRCAVCRGDRHQWRQERDRDCPHVGVANGLYCCHDTHDHAG